MVGSGNEYAVVMENDELKGLVSVSEIIYEVMSTIVSGISIESDPRDPQPVLLSELMDNPRTLSFMESYGFKGFNLETSIGESDTVEEAIQLMGSNSLEQALVLNDDGLVGILRNTDLLKARAFS